MKKVLVIGGGASGIIAACRSAELGAKVTLIEKNNKLGKKLYITGKGRCNITNNSNTEDLIKNTIHNPRFLYSAFSKFDAQDTISFFNKLGVSTKTERGNRVFPSSDKSEDVVLSLIKHCNQVGVKVMLNTAIKEITTKNNTVISAIDINNKEYTADSIIIATGGLSYPQTGSTGDGYRMAKDLGHTITELNPSLVPLITQEDFSDLQGLSLKNIGITIYQNNKAIYKDFGELLFTHFGVSGPVILSASCHISGHENCILSIDLKPALDKNKLNLRLLRDFEDNKNKDFVNSLNSLLPKALIPIITDLSNISASKKVNEITKSERQNLVDLLKDFKLTIKGSRGFNEAVITSGGILVKEINPATLESKICKGLYFAGEVIDIDAYTGGFNLQIAFSTGFLAGSSAAVD